MNTEERLAEIRKRVEAVEYASPILDLNRALDAIWHFRFDVPFLLSEIDRLTAERDASAKLVRAVGALLAFLGEGKEEGQ